jgi:glutamate dehydrogenase
MAARGSQMARGFPGKRGAGRVSNSSPQLSSARPKEQQARLVQTFAERVFKRLPDAVSARMSERERLIIAQQAFEFFAKRSETVKVGVIRHVIGGAPVTVIESAMADCAFIVDSWRGYLHELDLGVLALLHPIFSAARDAEGGLISLEENSARERRESLVAVIFDTELDAAMASQAAAEIEHRMHEVIAATTDFENMTARALRICEELAPVRELVELRDFLRWLVAGSFLFLGYERYTVSAIDGTPALVREPGSGLGILRDAGEQGARTVHTIESLERDLLFHGPVLIVSKSHIQSHVHRLEPMDDVVVRRVDGAGHTVAFDRFLGLFSSKAAVEEAEHVPILRDKLRQLLQRDHLLLGSHDYKELVAAFNSLPKEELFRASLDELRQELNAIIDSFGDTDVRVTMLSDAQRNIVVVMVLLPRERFSSEVRMQIQQALARRLNAAPIYYHLELREGYSAHLHFCFAASKPDLAILPALQAEVRALTRTWSDRLAEQLVAKFGEPHGDALAERYRDAFPAEYRASTDVARAIADIEQVEAALAGGTARVEVLPPSEGATATQMRIFQAHEPVVLSDLMPLLQNFGIRALSEDAHELKPNVDGCVQLAYVIAFQVQGPDGQPLNAYPGALLLAEALSAVRSGLAENDQLNALTLSATLGWREVALLRAYLAAAFQMKLGPARPALRRVFLGYPNLARQLVDFFVARMHPERETPAADLERMKAAYAEALAAVDNINDDRIARRVLAMAEATVRTNYFQPLSHPIPNIVLKFESARIVDLPEVAPLYEIHVDSPRMQGCHLRAGKVARGGIRWSDRLDDFRTEILDLMKTQTVKNAIIVPVGAKGGFIIKPDAGPTGPQEVVEAYKTLIDAMLDLTDNIVDGKVAHPSRVKVIDNDGAYLVVAADKGTAAFSDVANGLAEERGFWLGDAFASGGTHGYDHKQLGITARGAWESAKRHLREMGRDPERGAPVTMVGIGDMSGDVFGNGLLQSANVKLLAAFDHRHIFLDPDPDPAASFAERKRLFELPRSQWSDYNSALISAGGGVFRRGQKVIPLSPQVRAALGVDAAELDSDSLVRAILRAEVDLLYNGGIGTYVRASDETDAQVGDHTNDASRIVAAELRARVVVEGGNLGFSQKARIEYALRGGRINTDAIDNSAGVDLSDHEVNLKILFAPALARGAVSFEERNRVLQEAAAEVAEQVLKDNRDQVLLLSLEQIRSRTQASVFREHLTAIEQRGLLRRSEEALPTREALSERHARFAGLTRPELAVLAAYTKLDLSQRLESSAVVGEPYLVERYLRPYFPSSVTRRFGDEVPSHRLRRELIATQLVNELVDTMGATFVFGLVRDFDVSAEQVVRAWLIASDTIGLRAAVEGIKARSRELMVDAEMQALFALARAASHATCVILTGVDAQAADLAEAVNRLKPVFTTIAARFEGYLAGGESDRFERYYRELRTAGLSEADAHQIARLDFADHLVEIIRVGLELDVPAEQAAAVFFALAEAIDFSVMDDAIRGVGTEDQWERRAAQELDEGLRAARVRLTRTILADYRGEDRAEIVRLLSGIRPRQFEQVQHVLAEIRSLPSIALAPLLVAVRNVILLSLPPETSGQRLGQNHQPPAELLPKN